MTTKVVMARRASNSRNRCGVTGSRVTAPGMPIAPAITAPTALMPPSPPP
jgi:hypothetical protein